VFDFESTQNEKSWLTSFGNQNQERMAQIPAQIAVQMKQLAAPQMAVVKMAAEQLAAEQFASSRVLLQALSLSQLI